MLNVKATSASIIAMIASAHGYAKHIVGLPVRQRTSDDSRRTLRLKLLGRIDAIGDEIGKFDGDKKTLMSEITPALIETKAAFEDAGKMLWNSTSAAMGSADYRHALSIFDLQNGHLTDDSGLIAGGAVRQGRPDQTLRPAAGVGHD